MAKSFWMVDWLRSLIGLVTEEPALLSLSIRDSIAYVRFATFDQIEAAAKTAHAHGFISSLEKGYETQVDLNFQLKRLQEALDVLMLGRFTIILARGLSLIKH
ncbi:hypothetical protein BRADI_1g66254v3 [Brachypodium distachyon]|uniref:Uncharacterized protein n=1 Tax=Brachypodium distachyon TaxID=15368 RepID=A0A2K2DTN0_BRADI|nr:hypothetical protein BRADI_1g66254v3 [Brachypodium distachyon]